MIDLFSVKINGLNYDEIGATPSINSGLFLCDTTGENYVRGYSYKVETNNGNKAVTRFDAVSDYRIRQAVYPTIQNVCEWLNNWFTIKRNYEGFFQGDIYGAGGAYHELPQFPQTGDLCKIRVTDDWNYISTYNIFFLSYVTVNGGIVTADNPRFKNGETYFYYIMHLPQDVEKAISSLIYYDVYTRGTVDDLKSEQTGNYSYTKNDTTIGTLSYPYALIAGLEACYRKVRFVQ